MATGSGGTPMSVDMRSVGWKQREKGGGASPAHHTKVGPAGKMGSSLGGGRKRKK